MSDVTLKQISVLIDQKFDAFGEVVDQKINKAINSALEPIKKTLSEHSEKLDAITGKIEHPETGLNSINDKLLAVSGELHQVHKLANMTYEVVALQKEKYDAELDEIRDHTGMSPVHRVSLKM